MITPTRIWLEVTPGTVPVGSVHFDGLGAGLGGVLLTVTGEADADVPADAALSVLVIGMNAHTRRPSRASPTMAAGTRCRFGA
jgi:hypothetical protein